MGFNFLKRPRKKARVDSSCLFFPADQFISGEWGVGSEECAVGSGPKRTKLQPDLNPKPQQPAVGSEQWVVASEQWN